MAHFYGSVQGMRGEATRLGGKSSGMTTTAAAWGGAVRVHAYHDEATGADMARVTLGEWRGKGASPAVTLYEGPIAGPAKKAPADEFPWDDCKAAFGVDDVEPLGWNESAWVELPGLPAGWSLQEIDGAGARFVAVFRVEGPLTVADGRAVLAILRNVGAITRES